MSVICYREKPDPRLSIRKQGKSTVSSAQKSPGRVQIEDRAEKRVLRLSPARPPGELGKDDGV